MVQRRRSCLQEHLLSSRLLTVNADLNKSAKIMSDHIYSVTDNCWGTSVELKEA